MALCVAPLAVAALQCAACVRPQTTYRGTASLTQSGVPAAELAPQAPRLTRCFPSSLQSTDPNASVPPTVWLLSIGERCTMRGTWSGSAFQTNPALRCTLTFPNGERVLAVTDVSARFGNSGRYTDPDFLEVRLGGDMTAPDGTTKHALYQFSGGAVASSNAQDGCPP